MLCGCRNTCIFLFGILAVILTLITVVLLETYVYRKVFYSISYLKTAGAVGMANLMSAILGTPLYYLWSSSATELRSGWEGITAVMAVTTLISAFLLSVYIEYRILSSYFEPPATVKSLSWKANILSYAFLITAFVAVIIVS